MAGSSKKPFSYRIEVLLIVKKVYSSANKKSSHVKNDFEYIYITIYNAITYPYILFHTLKESLGG